MAQRIGCLIFLLPILELALLFYAGRTLGAIPVLGWVGLSAGLGLLLIRTQGIETLRRLQGAVVAGGSPARTLLDGTARWFAGALLLAPGFLTDLLALLLLFPPTRGLLGLWALARITRGVREGSFRVTMMGMHGVSPSNAPSVGPEEDPFDRPPRPGEIIQPPPGPHRH
jgi:UPF0716 protein FxsA